MARRTHLVGAWPGRDPEHAMELALNRLAPHLDRMSDGETGDRHLWITPALEKFRANPDVEMVHDGDWSGYDNVAAWRVREGVTLDPENIRLHYALAFENSFPSFKVLRERFGRPDLRFQVGIPMPIDMAVYAFGEAAFADQTILEACNVATLRDIARIHGQGGDEVVFQLETVVALVAVAQDRRGAGGPRRPDGRHLHRSRRAVAGGRPVRDPPVPRRLPPQGLREHARRPAPGPAGQRHRRRLARGPGARVRPRAVRRRGRAADPGRSRSTSRCASCRCRPARGSSPGSCTSRWTPTATSSCSRGSSG